MPEENPIATTMLRTTCTTLLCLTGLAAQERIDPRCFFLADYTNIVQLDLAAARKAGIWDDLVASGLNLARAPIEKELGFPVDHIDRFTMVIRFAKDEERDEQTAAAQRMLVLEGNAALSTPAHIDSNWDSQQVGQHTLRHQGSGGFAQPHDRLCVWGPRDVIVAALDGKRQPAVPSADVMSLSASRGNLIAHLVADLSARQSRREFLDMLLPDTEWPADDSPTFFAARLSVIGEADDPHLAIDLVVRHAKGDAGIAVTERAVDAALARGLETTELRILYPVLKAAEKQRDGCDLRVRFDLGRSRTAIGNLALLFVPLLTARSDAAAMAAQAAHAEALEAAKAAARQAPAPKTEPAPKKPKPAGGGQR
jgi:hypothetical protein